VKLPRPILLLFGMSQLSTSSTNKALSLKSRVTTLQTMLMSYYIVHRSGLKAKIHETENNIMRPRTRTRP